MGPATKSVVRFSDIDPQALVQLLARFGLTVERVKASESIPGSFWGDEEAGLIGDRLLLRPDTPLHSALHEACHYICMNPSRRSGLDTDAGGDYDEENAVCYLQILLADEIPGLGRDRMMADMDAWGYTFRLGSARAWFTEDADDAETWLVENEIISSQLEVSFRLRRAKGGQSKVPE
jgi:hypothetical protein